MRGKQRAPAGRGRVLDSAGAELAGGRGGADLKCPAAGEYTVVATSPPHAQVDHWNEVTVGYFDLIAYAR